MIIAVNAAWTAEVRLAGVGPEEVGIGADYVAVMRRAASTSDGRRRGRGRRRGGPGRSGSTFEWATT